MEVEDYIREFELLQIKSGIHEESKQILARFVSGLVPLSG